MCITTNKSNQQDQPQGTLASLRIATTMTDTRTSTSNCHTVTLVPTESGQNKPQDKDNDAFLYYSNPTNLMRTLKCQPPITTEDNQDNLEDSSNANVVRKTRLSFEGDAVTIMLDLLGGNDSDENDEDEDQIFGFGPFGSTQSFPQ